MSVCDCVQDRSRHQEKQLIEEPSCTATIKSIGVPPRSIRGLGDELRRLGFQTEELKQELGAQNNVEWAFPPETVLLLSFITIGGTLMAKKFVDGFLEEIGVKALGSSTAQAMKRIFSAGMKSRAGYYTERKEPTFDQPSGPAVPVLIKLSPLLISQLNT
jgi:hypothetical protein